MAMKKQKFKQAVIFITVSSLKRLKRNKVARACFVFVQYVQILADSLPHRFVPFLLTYVSYMTGEFAVCIIMSSTSVPTKVKTQRT